MSLATRLHSRFLRLRRPPQLRYWDLVLFLLPLTGWVWAISSRPELIHLRCIQNPSSCRPESVFLPDQAFLGHRSGQADHYSFVTQDLSGALAIGLPVGWSIVQGALGALAPGELFIGVITDTVILGQTIAWNGLATEAVRLLVQRPRPFVYADPGGQGGNPAHYTSFISGHTSFAAAVSTSTIASLAGRTFPAGGLGLVASLMVALVILTGVFRVLSGRHFPTDVLAAAIVGLAIGLTIAWLHRPKTPRSDR